MPVELILAPPATGKTTACIQRIQSLRQREPLAPVWVLIPDAQNATHFRQRLARTGGGLGVNVSTFRTLYTDLLERCGRFTPVITPALAHRLVQEAIDAAYAAGGLTHYAAIRTKPGFISVLQDIFSELRSAYISPERFSEYTHNAGPAKSELASLYARFVAQLEAIGWIDHHGQIWEAIDILEKDPGAAAHIRLLVVDGFSAFAGARLAFLKGLAAQVGELLITLPGQGTSTRPVHRRVQPVIEALMRELAPLVTQLTTPPHLPPASQHLEQHVLDPGEFHKLDATTPIFLAAQSQGEEAREALRWVKRLHLREGLPLSDCALFVSHLEDYRPHLRAAAAEFGMRVHFSQPDPLTASPAVGSLLNLLELPRGDFKTRAVFNALRSPYFNFGLSTEDVDHLELVSQKARIVSGKAQWAEAWEMLIPASRDAGEALDDERRERNPLRDVDLPALQSQFSSFWRTFDEIGQARSQTAWVAWLEATLANLGFYGQLISERDHEAYQILGETLGALVLSEQVLGERLIDYERFLSDLTGAVHGARWDELREARQDAIFIGAIHRAEASRFKAVALLGFSEGLFPVVEHPDPFLDEETRLDLGLDPQLGREQAGTFYQAVTRAERHLLITRPYLAEHGESWDASPYWAASASLFSDSALQKVSPGTARQQSEAASPQELLFWAVQQKTLHYHNDGQLVSGCQDLRRARAILAARRSKQPGGIYEGDTETLTEELAEKYAPGHTWSSSRLETYATCPYQYYVQNELGLEPKEPPELGLDAAQVGTILHAILEQVYQKADSTTDLVSLLAILANTAASVCADAPRKLGFRPSPLWEVEQAQFIDMLHKTIEALYAESQGWTPIRFEAKFGIHDTPALELDLGSEFVRLRGVIDRVDQRTDGLLRVIDYKTGGSHLAASDLHSGRRLQLAIYALAAQEALGLGTVVEGFYWQIRAAKASSIKLSRFKTEGLKGPEAAYTVALDHIKNNLVDIRSGQFPPIPPKGGCPSYCPAVLWCWRYQAGY
ncbi:MAG: PD-(D/E)XK nuclease family protein [Brevefilum sp.]